MNSTSTPPTAPQAARRPFRIEAQGDVRIDNYFWLREREDPDVLAYLEAENAYTAASLAHTATLQETLYQEMRGRIKETDATAPLPDGDAWYYERTEAGKEYPIYCRRRGSLDAPEEIMLDGNQMAEGHDFFAVGGWRVSPNGQLLAYAVDFEGHEQFTIRIKDLASGELLPDQIANAYYGLEWGNDNRTLFYTTLGAAHRPDKLWRHTLGTAEDVLVFTEPDERFFVGVEKTRSGAYLLVVLGSNTMDEVWFIPADTPTVPPQVIEPRRAAHEYMVDQHGEFFLLCTNDKAANFRVVATPVTSPHREAWREIVAHHPDVLIEGMAAFAGHVAIFARTNGLRTIEILQVAPDQIDIQARHTIAFPDPVYTYRPLRNAVYDTNWLRFMYTSLKTPPTVFAYDMQARTLELVKQDEIAGFDPANYVTARLWATAADGVQVPISIVHRKGLVLDGSHLTWLYGYGSYGASSDPLFVANRISLLDRGFVFAIAHVRGGSEMGRHWYEDGKLLNKLNTFTDFIACAEHLVAQGYTRPEGLMASGRSAGGLLMGAVANLRPDLFAAIIAGVPFVDVMNTMLDASIPLTVMEYDEWGNPSIKEQYDYMRAYSPYDNLEAKAYPRLLATAGLSDPRVQYWEPAKWVAKLRTLKTDRNLLLLKTVMAGGHFGVSGRYGYLRDVALEYAFFLDTVGITE